MLAFFSANLGSCSIMRAELRAAEIGLTQAWELEARKAILLLDLLATMSSITQPAATDTRNGFILLQIRELLQRDWHVEVRHTYKEANWVVDLLAHLGHSLQFATHFLDCCPPNTISVLSDDCIRVSIPRLIPILN
ncbi:Putative ribonuclease H protein At1g65750 [Linum perenne]